MKYSVYSCVGQHFPIEDRMAAIKAVGFDCVCLDFEDGTEPTETSWENQLFLADKYNLTVENAHLTGYGMNSVWSDCPEGERVKDRLIDELRRMSELGVKIGVAHVTWGLNAPERNFELGLRRYREAVEAAEKYGVCLALENSVFPEYVHHLLTNLKSPNLGFCYDSGHENAFTHGENYLERYSDILIAMHLHDNDGIHDDHAMPFHGTICWEEKAEQLKKCARAREMLTLECGIGGNTPEEGFGAALAELKKLAALMEK